MKSRFEKAYCALYSDKIGTIAEFAEMAGIEDVDEAFRRLREYRAHVLAGEIPDPMEDCFRLPWRSRLSGGIVNSEVGQCETGENTSGNGGRRTLKR